jgi:hypothetical protein
MPDVPPWRLNLLRAFYLLVALGTAFNFGPLMLSHSHEWAQRKGEVGALLSALALLCFLGLRYPLQMLPLLIFELLWKLIWLGLIAWPLWRAGALTPAAHETAVACLAGVVLTPLVLPWRHVWQRYLSQPAESWR